MATLAISALSALGVGGTAAVGGALGTATAGLAGVAGAAAGAGGGLSILQGIATALSVFGTIGAGNAKATEATSLADATDLQAGQEKLQAAQRQLKMSQDLAQVIGQNDVTFASAGIDISQGIAANNRANAKTAANQAISIDRQSADYRAALLRKKAAGYRQAADSARSGALLDAFGKVAGFGIDLAQRG